MKKLFICFLVTVFAISMVFIGIGCKEEVPAEEEVTDEIVEEVPAEEDVKEEEVTEERPFEGVELVVMVRADRGTKELLEDHASELYEETGIMLKLPDLPYNKLHDQLITDFVSGSDAYDVVIFCDGWIGEMGEYLEVLDPYIERDNFDIEDYFPALQKYSGLKANGERVGIPNKADTMTLYYRTDIFDDMGFSDPANWSWEDFIEAEKQLKEGGVVEYPLVTAGVNIQLVKFFFATLINQGGDVCNKVGEPTFNNEKGLKALETIKEMFSYSPEAMIALDNNDASQIFFIGDAAMLINWPVAVKDINDPDKSDIIGKWAATAPPGPGNIGSDCRVITKSSDNKEAAWAFLKWLHSKEMTLEIVKYTGQICGRQSVAESEEMMELIPGADGASEAVSRSFILTHVLPLPNFMAWFVDVGEQCGNYLIGSISAQEALDNMEQKWNDENAEQIGEVEIVTFSEQLGNK